MTPAEEAAVGGSGDDGVDGVDDDACQSLAGPTVAGPGGPQGKSAPWASQPGRRPFGNRLDRYGGTTSPSPAATARWRVATPGRRQSAAGSRAIRTEDPPLRVRVAHVLL